MLEIAESFQITLSTLCTDPVPSLLSASCPAAVLLDEKDFVLTGLCKVMGVIVESKWMAFQRRGDCVLDHVFHLGYLSYFVSKQATNRVMGLQKEHS